MLPGMGPPYSCNKIKYLSFLHSEANFNKKGFKSGKEGFL
jgi:hypothetical protein